MTLLSRRVPLFLTLAGAALLAALLVIPWAVQAQSDPAAPSNLTGEVLEEGVGLSWDAPAEQADTVTGYQVLRRRPAQGENSLLTLVDDTGSTATSYTDGTATEAGVRYVYRVKARRGSELSGQSNYVNVQRPEGEDPAPTAPTATPTRTPTPTPMPTPAPTPMPAVPAQPTGLTATSVSHDGVTLSWDDPDDASITHYQVLRRDRDADDPGVFDAIEDDTGSTATSYTDEKAKPAKRYVYRVVAVNGQGASPRSGYVNVETPDAPDIPAAPTGLSAPSVSHDSVTLSWDDPSDASITGYQVLRRSRDGDEYGDGQGMAELVAIVDDTGSAATSYADTSVTARTRYVYSVRARTSGGLGGQSSHLDVETPAYVPATPTGLAVESYAHNSVALVWDNPGDDSILRYEVLRRLRGDHQIFAIIVGRPVPSRTEYRDEGLAAETGYTYQVRAVSANGPGPVSEDVTVETTAQPVPAQPTGLIVESYAHDSVTLSWDDPEDDSITGYQVLRRSRDGKKYGDNKGPEELSVLADDTATSDTTYTDTSVTARTRYEYAVKARNLSGPSGRSDALPVETRPELTGRQVVIPDSEDDATLSGITVDGSAVPGFSADRDFYQYGVANSVTSVTVAGVALDANATVTYSGTDADSGTDGHQVELSVGRNLVTVTVTATDGGTKGYTVSVNRGSDAPYDWKAEDDFDTLKAAGNIRARGIWSDGTTMWVGDDGPNKLFAYTLATRQRNPDEDFDALHEATNRSIRGLWSDGTTMWVADYNDERIYAYARTTKERDEDSDFTNLVDPEPRWSWGLWSDGTTIWIADPVFDGIYAYELHGRVRDSAKDISPAQGEGNIRASDIWSDGTTMWVSDQNAGKLFAYALDTGQRDHVRDFAGLEAGNVATGGIWSDGTTMWVADRLSQKLYAYNMPGNPDLNALSLSAGTLTPMLSPTFHRVTTAYAVSVENSVSTITVAATAVDAGNAMVEFLDADSMPLADADGVTDGQQVNLVVGDKTIKVKVTADDGVVTRTYTLVVTREAPSTDLSALSVGGKSVAGFAAETTSYQFGVDNLVTQVTVAGVPFDASATVTYSGTDANTGTDGHQVDLSGGANVVTVTVTDRDGVATKDYTVSVNRGSDAPFGWKAEDDFDTLKAAGNIRPRGLWSDGTTMWVGDDGPNKLFAYVLDTGQRNSDEDFNALHEAGNHSPRGLWSDDTTMWVVDYSDNRIYAYARTTKQRDEDSEFLDLASDGPTWSWGLWSDGTTMWIGDPVDDKIYAYELVGRVRDSDKDIIPAQSDGNIRSTDIWSDGTTMWVGDWSDDKIYAYDLASGQRDAVRDFDVLAAVGDIDPTGIWSDGATMWVADWAGDKIYAYNMPGNPDLSALRLSAGTSTPTWSPSFHRLTTAYAVSVENSVSTITVAATAADAGNATVEFLDADSMPLADAETGTNGHQVNLVVGDKTFKVKVTADDGVVTRTYTLVVTREAPAPVSFGSSSYNVGEGESVTVTVSLDQALSGQVVVPLNVTDGSGVSSADYSGVPARVTIASGATSATFSFSAGDDDLVEEDEVVTVTFGTLPSSVIEGSPATTTVTITNDDEPSWALSVTPASIVEADASSSKVSVSSGGVTFTSAKTINLGFEGTATKSTDYTVAAETLTLAAGRSSVSTTVSALDDAVADASETILVTATLDGGTIGAQQLITVVDDEQVASNIVLEVSPSVVGEGAGATTLTVTGTLDGAALTTDTVVSLTLAAGTATESDDYTVGSATTTLRIAARVTSGTASFALTPVDDMIDDDDETVTIAAAPTSTLTLSPASLTVTITDNDEPNVAPVFEPPPLTRSLEENSGAGVAIGAAVTATDEDGDMLSYSLDGVGAGSFRIDSASGQISTAPGVAYDYESATNSYALTVTATDPRGGEASATVTVEISDVDEPPPRPAAPSVSPTSGAWDSLDVSWLAPSMSGRPGLSGYALRYRPDGGAWVDWTHAGTGTVATIDELSPDTNYDVQLRAINDEGESRWSPSGDGSTFATDDPCLVVGPTPTVVAVTSVPIVVASTTDVYFVLYVTHELDGAEVLTPVAVTRGEAGTTTLDENVEALPAGRYRVEQYDVADPADIDGDCIDDLTELVVMGRMNPLNPAPAILRNDGAVAIPDGDTFEELSYTGPDTDYEYVKFALLDMDTEQPLLYFINSETHLRHPIVLFLDAIGHTDPDLPWAILGEIVYDPDLVAADGTQGVYYFWFVRYDGRYTFKLLDRAHALLTGAMPLLGDIEGDKLSMYIPNHRLPGYQTDLEMLRESRIPLLFNEDIYPDTDFLALNPKVGYGLLRVMEAGERPSPLNVVIYESLPNELPRVAGIITTVPQTPLSHVNLRAVQDSVPNAYIKGALDEQEIDDLIDSFVRYEVTADGYTLRAATKAEVDAHHAASRPARTQTPERDLTVTEITPLSDVGFDDWRAFGVKAANVAVLGTLDFPDGTVPNGFAIPFHFYNEFMNNAVLAAEKVFGKGTQGTEEDRFTMPAGTKLIDAVKAILAHPRFQTDFEIQDEMLDDLREVIEEAGSPQWIIDALTAMHATYPEGQRLRYRSSTNNEDLPGFSGAGLYDSNTQKPKETEEEGIDKSMKQVFASLWNFRAFTEREFHRIDHLATAMGVLVHPNYSDELANGVAASFDPIRGLNSYYYLNTQLGEDLVTNPEANSEPEEILVHRSGDYYEILATSNQVAPGELLLSDAQMEQLAEHLTVIHERFAELYGVEEGERFAMEIEFKITSEDILAIKQARPWVFAEVNEPPAVTAVPTRTSTSGSGGGSGGGGTVNQPPVFEDADGNTVAEISREIAEDAALGAKVGEPVVAADPDGDTLAYTLGGDDAASFTIDASTGQLTTQTALDHQTKPDYAVTVVATDPSGATAEIRVAITVTAVSFDCSAGNAVADAANNPGLVADCEALLRSRDRLAGDATLDWSEDTSITGWDGVRLGGTPKRVTQLYLVQKNLDGTVPADLASLSELTGLYLHRNELTGPIPSQLGELSSLVHLTLHRNRLWGEMPDDLGDLTALTFLSLYGNNLAGELPAELGGLSNLRWLYLHSNKSADGGGLSGPIPASFGDLQNLERLLLYGNSFSGPMPAELARLSNLKSLLLHDNELTGQIPSELGDLSRLRYLWLDDNDLSGVIPAQLGNLSSLRWLSLYGNSLSGAIPAELGDLSALRLLILDRNDLSGPIPSRLGELSELTWLDLNDNDLSGPIPGSLGDLSNLVHLYLHSNGLSGAVPSDLGRLSNLTNLWLWDNRLSGQIPPSLGDLLNLQRVRIAGNDFTGCIPEGLLGGSSWYSDAEELGLPVCHNNNGS